MLGQEDAGRVAAAHRASRNVAYCGHGVQGPAGAVVTTNGYQKARKNTKTPAHMLERVRFEFLCIFVFFVAIPELGFQLE